jgi:hypothetical protein
MSLAAARIVAVRHEQSLRLYGLDAPNDSVLHVPDAAEHALQPDTLLVSDSNGRIERYEPHRGDWRVTAEMVCPQVAGAASPRPTTLLLSPSARYLLTGSALLPRSPSDQRRGRAFVLDARSGEVKYEVPLHEGHVRAGFSVLPGGQEVLFVSAESYMSVQMVDCASGRVLHEYRAMEESFCHTDYALTPDARRLIAFGCWWAFPYGARIYDATPWTGDTTPASEFPLPVVYSHEQKFDCDMVLPIEPAATGDRTLTCVALAPLANRAASGSAEDAEYRGELTSADREIYEAMRPLSSAAYALLIRRVDPETGALAGWSVHEIRPTAEWNVHTLPNHRVLVVNDRVQIADALAGTVEDLGPSGAGTGWFTTAATDNGETVVLWQAE